MTSPELPDGVSVETVYVVEISYAPDAKARRPAVRLEHLTRAARLRREGTLIEAGGYLDWRSALLLGAVLGDVLPDPHLAALTTTGGLMLVGVALRLLRIKQLPVGDLLPALLIAPLLTQLVIALR